MIAFAAVRLGLLGPARGDLVALARAARILADHAHVDRVVYLGADGALDRVVASWATTLVGGDPSDARLFGRAARACVDASAAAVAAFVAAERGRAYLRSFAALPPPPARTVEIVDGRVAVLVHDKATLDEDDIASAALLVFGRSEAPVLRRVGTRTFLSPGPIVLAPRPSFASEVCPPEVGATQPYGVPLPTGVAVLSDDDGARFELYDEAGHVAQASRLEPPRSTGMKLRVQ